MKLYKKLNVLLGSKIKRDFPSNEKGVNHRILLIYCFILIKFIILNNNKEFLKEMALQYIIHLLKHRLKLKS